MSFVGGQEELQAKKRAGRVSSFLNCYLHVAIKSFLKLSLRNPDPHDLSHTSSANKAVSVASLTSGGSTLMPNNPDARSQGRGYRSASSRSRAPTLLPELCTSSLP